MGTQARTTQDKQDPTRHSVIKFLSRHRQQLASVPREGGCAATRVLARAYGASLGVERMET